jgi:pimeloyl-ACP methyl ester carboxylesterase
MIISSSSSRESLKLIEMTYGQSNTNNTNANPAVNSTTKLPVLLIHGYMEDASVWNKWINLLKNDGISAVYPITFKQSDDECGSSVEHAKELLNINGQIKKETGQIKVNIIGHSKGGLDARVYLANNQDVANLIMIGTPNAGSPLAEQSNMGAPAVYDLRPGAATTEVKMNPNTKYYTIAGDWNPELENCQLTLILSCEQSGFSSLPIPNDGMVSVSSVESQDYFINLGHSKNCHSNLLSDYEYELAKDLILGKK